MSCRRVAEGGSVAQWLACWTQAQKARVGLPYVRVSRTRPLFGLCPGVRAGFRKSAVCPGFWPNPQVAYIRTLPIAKAYDGIRQRKLVSFQYKMSVTSQNAILVQACVHVG